MACRVWSARVKGVLIISPFALQEYPRKPMNTYLFAANTVS